MNKLAINLKRPQIWDIAQNVVAAAELAEIVTSGVRAFLYGYQA